MYASTGKEKIFSNEEDGGGLSVIFGNFALKLLLSFLCVVELDDLALGCLLILMVVPIAIYIEGVEVSF